jgi:hypothetical protein
MKKQMVTALAAAAFAFACPAIARADEATLRDDMESYARGKTGESLAYMGAGVASLAGGGASLAEGGPVYRGLAVPLLVGGAVELASGGVLYARTARWRSEAEGSFSGDFEGFRAKEIDRVSASRRGLGAVTVLETVLFAGGGALAYFSAADSAAFLRGVGFGCALEGAAMLTLDVFASLRADRYTDALLASGVGVRAEHAGASLTWQRRF